MTGQKPPAAVPVSVLAAAVRVSGNAEGAARTTDGGWPLRGGVTEVDRQGQEALASVFSCWAAAGAGAGLAAS